MIRELRQHLDSLRLAGVDRVPFADIPHPPPPRTAVRSAPDVKAPTPPPVRTTPVARPPAIEAATPPPPVAIILPPETPAATPKPTPVPAPVSAAPVVARSLFAEPVAAEPEVPAGERAGVLAELASVVAGCVKCPLLASTRTQTVFGTGSPTARLMFIGEAPGADEDRTGEPFVGRAGVLLTDMITKGMGLTRAEVYIANVLKSRPPANRDPEPAEVANCLPYLERQVAVIRPEFLCLLGKTAASALLDTALPMARLRGRWHRYRDIPAVVTYHPSYLLRAPAAKKDAWDDLQMLMKAMGLAAPDRKRPDPPA